MRKGMTVSENKHMLREDKTKVVKKYGKLFIALIACIIIGTVSMIGVYSIPTNRLFSHAKSNAEMFEVSFATSWAPGLPSATLSYPTDAIMINNAIYQDSEGAVYNSMMNPRYEDGAGYPTNSLYKVLQYKKNTSIKPRMKAITPADSFKDEKNTTHEIETMYYPRYWHGYLVVLKPMLLFLDVSEIKMLMMIIQVLLLALTVYLINKRIGLGVAVAFLTTYIVLNPVTIALNFQNNTCYILSLICMVFVLLFNDSLRERNNYELFFMIWGCTTTFFDFLTYPLVVLGFSLCLVVLLNSFDKKHNIVDMIKISIAWSVGYVGMWIGKMIVSALLAERNLLKTSIDSVLFRMGVNNLGHKQLETPFLQTLKYNLTPLCNWSSLFLLFIVFSIFVVLKKKGYRKELVNGKLYCLLLLSLYPIIWYLGTTNHSTIHYYMTYRELSISWFCLTTILLHNQRRNAPSD